MENIKTIALKYITFSKDLQLVYFEFFGKRYDIKCTKDIYDELVKLLVEKYSDLITYQDNKLILQRNSFKLELYKKENLPTYTKTRHIFSDWYLITHFPIAQLEKKIREIVSAFDFDDEKIIIGYYPKKQEERKQEQEMENKSKIKEITLKEITFSDDLNFAYFEVYEKGEEYGFQFDVQNIKDIYEDLVKLFVEKYPNCLIYNKNYLSIEKDNFILRLYKEKYFSNFALKFGYIRNIFEDWYLYVQYPIFEFEQKIKKIVSAMELNEEDVIFGYYANEKEEEQIEEQKEEQIEEQINLPAEIENTDSNIQKTTLRDITFSRDIKFAYCEIFGKKYNIKIERDLYQLLVKLFVEKHPNSLIYEDDKIIVYDKIKLYKYSYILNNRKQLNIKTRFRHIFEDWYLDVDRVISTLEDRIRRCVFALGLFEDEVIIGYYSNNVVYYQPKQIKEPQQIKYTQKIKPPILLNSNIQIVNLRDITFTKELKLAYFEVLGKRYEIKNTRDIIQELVKLFIEKYPNLCRYENNHFVLERYNFGIKLYRKEEYAHRPEFLRHILEDWYLYVNYNISVFEEQIRKIVSAMDIPEDEVIIGYYPNNAFNYQPRQIIKEAQPIRKEIQQTQEESKEIKKLREIEVPKQNIIPQEIEKTKVFTNFDSIIQTTTLRDITFSKEIKLAYCEIFGEKYEVERARDLYFELVKLFVEKYPNYLTNKDNKLILERNNFKLSLYKKDDILSYNPRLVFEDWYLNVNYVVSFFDEQIRKIVHLFNIPAEEVIIGYYPNDAVSFPNVEVKENQVVNSTPVKTKPEQPKEDMLLFSSDLKKIKNKFFDYLLNVKNFEEVKAKNYTLAFNFYCYSNNISFSLNNVAYFEEQIANDELLSANEIIANRTREVFPVFLDFLQYTKEQKEKKLETIKTNCVSILKEKFANGYRVSESAKIDYKKFCNFYKNKFDKELELEREELNDFLKSFTFLYLDTIYLPEFVISEETKNNLFDFIEKCFSEHKFAYYDTIYNKFSSEFYGGMITTHEILKKYLLEINGKEINFKDNGDYISVLNENIDFNYIFKHFENWFCDVGRVVKMDEIENNFFNMANYNDDKKNNRIKDFVRDNKKIILNSYSKENGSDYFHLDIIYLTNQDINKIGEFFKNRIQNGQFISDEEFFTLLRNNEEFSERYDFISDLGLKKYFQIKLDKILRFRNQKVELRSSYVSYDDIIEKFVDNKKKFELEDVKNLMKDLNYSSFDQIYQKIAECATRISENEFISNENIDFFEYIDEIDSLISEFCGDKKYVFIKDVTVFAGFPNVGYAWNKFLLESYVNRYSRRYKLLNTVFFRKNVYGVIVDKKSNLTLNDCLADVLLDSSLRVEEEAVKYLVENDYLYKVQNISDVMAKVRER